MSRLPLTFGIILLIITSSRQRGNCPHLDDKFIKSVCCWLAHLLHPPLVVWARHNIYVRAFFLPKRFFSPMKAIIESAGALLVACWCIGIVMRLVVHLYPLFIQTVLAKPSCLQHNRASLLEFSVRLLLTLGF